MVSNDWLVNPPLQSLLDEIDAKISNLKYVTKMGKEMWGEWYEHDDLKLFEAIRTALIEK